MPFSLQGCWNGVCFVYIISGAAHDVPAKDNVSEFSMIDLKQVRDSLQSWIKRTKKLSRGRKALFDAYEKENLSKTVTQTPVKKRLFSVIVMMKMM